jgi:hypothetical protein
MKRILALAILALVASSAMASIGPTLRITADPQTGTHQGQLSWVAPVTTGVVYTGFNVYRATCTGTVTAGVCSTDSTATFAKITATALPATALSYTDTPLTAATSYIWYVTSLCATCTTTESIPSNHVAGTTTANQPPPPVLSITSVAMNVTGNTETVTAQWTDTSGTQQAFKFSNGTSFVAQGLTSDPSGNFAQRWTGPAGTPIIFMVSNAAGISASQAAK